MPGSVQCSRCSKVLPAGGGFCRRCGWPTTHAVAVPGEGPPPLTPPGFFPPLPPKEDAAPASAVESRWATVPAVMVLVALIAAGIAGRRSFLARRAQAATAAADASDPSRGTWRVIQSQRGQTVRDFLVAEVRQLGARNAGGTPLPDDAVRAVKAHGRRSLYGLECVVANRSQWGIREICVEARTWKDQHTTRTVVYRVACNLGPGRSGATAVPLPLDVGPDQRTELVVVSALGVSPYGRPPGW